MKIEAWLRSTWAIGAIVIFAAFLLSTRSVGEEASSGGNTGLDSAVAPKESPSPGDDAGLSALTTARPVPLLPLPQEGSGRGAERRLEYLQEDFGTVSKDLGNGAVSTTPVSPKLKQSIQKRGAVHPPEDVATALQGSIDPAGSKVKSERLIFGSDDRVQITDTAPYPFRAVGQLAIRSGGSLKAWCSATLIAPRFVLTAAHCLYDPETRLWVDEVSFYPGRNGRIEPFGEYYAERLYVLSGYIQSTDWDWTHLGHDFGLVKLKERAGDRVGWFTFGFDDALPPFVANMIAYQTSEHNVARILRN